MNVSSAGRMIDALSDAVRERQVAESGVRGRVKTIRLCRTQFTCGVRGPRIVFGIRCEPNDNEESACKQARPEGVEPPTYGFEVRRSIQLSYGRVKKSLSPNRIQHLAHALEPGE